MADESTIQTHATGADWTDGEILDAAGLNYIQNLAKYAVSYTTDQLSMLEALAAASKSNPKKTVADYQAQARDNIDAIGTSTLSDALTTIQESTVSYIETQNQSDTNKAQARTNIGAASEEEFEQFTTFRDNVFANTFDTTQAYSVGDYCIYNNKLYQCTTAVEAGDWQSSAWNPITIMPAITTAVAQINDADTTIRNYIESYPDKIKFTYNRTTTSDSVTQELIYIDVPTNNNVNGIIRYTLSKTDASTSNATLTEWWLNSILFLKNNNTYTLAQKAANELITNFSQTDYNIMFVPASGAKIFIDGKFFSQPSNDTYETTCSRVQFLNIDVIHYIAETDLTSKDYYTHNYLFTNKGVDIEQSFCWDTNTNASILRSTFPASNAIQSFDIFANAYNRIIHDYYTSKYGTNTLSSATGTNNKPINWIYLYGVRGGTDGINTDLANYGQPYMKISCSQEYTQPLYLTIPQPQVSDDNNSATTYKLNLQLSNADKPITNNTIWQWKTTITANVT